jgi:hypothetical protein
MASVRDFKDCRSGGPGFGHLLAINFPQTRTEQALREKGPKEAKKHIDQLPLFFASLLRLKSADV